MTGGYRLCEKMTGEFPYDDRKKKKKINGQDS